MAENDDSESSEEHNAESSLFDKNREISEMDRLKTVPCGDEVGVKYMGVMRLCKCETQ